MIDIADNLELPDRIATETSAVLGRRGSGKSNTATAIIEGLSDNDIQFVLIDPKGEGWGLRAEGTGQGLDVIVFGEPNGDLPLDESHGETIADFVVESGRSCVLSLQGFASDASERRFVEAFCTRLYRLKSRPENQSPLMVAIEECHLFVPQRVDGDAARCVRAVQRLVRQGRSYGLGVMLIDQRPASVNKDVLTQIELMICHQVTAPQDRKAIQEWVSATADAKQGRDFLDQVSRLEPGEAFVWSPAWLKLFKRVKVRRRRTLDTGATPDASTKPAATAMREVDLEALREQLAAIVQEKQENDPKVLRKRIAELEKQIGHRDAETQRDASAEQIASAMGERDAAWGRVIDDVRSQLSGLVTVLAGVDQRIRAAWDVTEMALADRAKIFRPEPAAVQRALVEPVSRALVEREQARVIQAGKVITPSRTSVSRGKRSPGERILDAIAWFNSIGVQSPSRMQVGFVAGIKPTGGHFSNTIGPLSTGGLIEYAGDGVMLTAAGRSHALPVEQPPTLRDYHDSIRALLKKGPTVAIFDAIVVKGGRPIDVNVIGHGTGINPSGGHFSNSIGPLSTLGLITRKDGVVRPTSLLFPEGLR